MLRFRFVLIILTLSALISALPSVSEAQIRAGTTVGETYRVETTDGSIFVGELISESSEAIVLLTESSGEITIRRANISRMTLVDTGRVVNGRNWYENPHPTRYLFAPNAIGLKKGKGYYQNTWVFFNNVNYGVSDNFSVGLGLVPLFLFGTSTPVWITPKVSFPVIDEQLHLSAGALLGGIIGTDGGIGGVFFGSATYGSTDSNVSLSLGYGYSDAEISSTPVLNLSAMHRISRRSYIITENYFFPGSGENVIISAAYRFAAESASLDFGLVRPLEDFGTVIGIPWLGIAIPFGN
ncbi:MAG: hypothetical protein LAT84_07505 [Balneolia bacterium]|nr:hypothetical protein [Balneolia bacterium]